MSLIIGICMLVALFVFGWQPNIFWLIALILTIICDGIWNIKGKLSDIYNGIVAVAGACVYFCGKDQKEIDAAIKDLKKLVKNNAE